MEKKTLLVILLMKQALLDTNILIYFLKGDPKALEMISLFDKTPFVSAVTVMELYHGARGFEQEQEIHEVLQYVTILPLDQSIAKKAGEMLSKRSRSGKTRFHKEDFLIAATALVHECVLVTANVEDFSYMNELSIQKFTPSSS